MKLSYTMHNWPGREWPDSCAAAAETKIQAVEMDSVQNPIFCTRTSPTNPELALSVKRSLTRKDLSIPCIGTAVDFSAPEAASVIRDTIAVARNLSVPYVVLSTVLSTLYNTFLTPAILNFAMGYGFDRMTNQEIVAMLSNGLWIYLAVVVVACAVFYFPTRIILDKKLNLE